VPETDWIIRVALVMQFGGAVGNLIDRLTIGHVVDFISVGTFPVFNVADSNISVGVVVLLLGIWIQERRNKPKVPSQGFDEQNLPDTEPEKKEA
jgi:signal peptidase II